MGFENLFFKKEKATGADNSNADELDERGKGRRGFLIGSGALVAASMLQLHTAEAQESSAEPILSPEDRERNIEKIRRYELYLQNRREDFDDPTLSKQDFLNMLHGEEGMPPTDRSLIEGTEIDREAFFRANGTWPSVQILVTSGNPEIRFAHLPKNENSDIIDSANGFFVHDALIANKHMIANSFKCELIENDKDIGGCSLKDMNADSGTLGNIQKTSVSWNREKAAEDLHGKLVHMPSIHDQRGNSEDGTDITSGVLFKLTPSFVKSLRLSEQYKGFESVLLNSYACFAPPRDSNEDGVADHNDIRGVSGSPIFSDEDCAEGENTPSGIQWGAMNVVDRERGVSHTLLLVHGPDTLGAMIDKVNTILSVELSEAEAPNKRELSTKVQQALVSYGYKNLPIDGDYGEDTKTVVRLFQERVFDETTLRTSIIPGVMDRKTWNALFPQEQDPNKKILWG